jgi:sugar phosphate isomerase/epimerase
MGLGMHSYALRRFEGPAAFLDHARAIGAGGVQTSLGIKDDAACDRLRAKAEEEKLYLEGSIALPRKESDLDRFREEVRTAKRSGVTVFRTVLLGGRRYEVLESQEAFRAFVAEAQESITRARPVVEKYEIRMAIENHKDLRSVELLDLLKKAESPFVGVCVDTGNNIALLEPPEETVELLGPHAFSTHIKDMGVEEYPDGFLLSEVPLGTGFLDLPKIVSALRRGKPEIKLNLEMMTRDPLKIPCLTPKFWATLEEMRDRRLAEMLRLVRAKAAKTPLPRPSGSAREEQARLEDANVDQCLKYSREHLEG